MSGKYELRTPVYKRKQTAKATPSTSKATIHMDYTPSKRCKPDYTVKNIEDEEFPAGYNLDTVNPSGKSDQWKPKHSSRSNKENCGLNSDDQQFNSSDDIHTPATSKRNGSDMSKLSILAHYDEIIRCYEEYYEDDITVEFLSFAEQQELCRLEWLKAVNECKRLQAEVEKVNRENGDYSNSLKYARRLLDQETKKRKRAEEERNNLEQQMSLARDLLFSDKCNRIPDDTREKLAFLNNTSARSCTSFDRNGLTTGTRLNTINEINSNELNSTGSLLSDFSYSRSEDGLERGLDVSGVLKPEWKRVQQLANLDNASPPKKRKSDHHSSTHKVVEINATDKIVATTTLSVSKEGPITATSIIEAIPQDADDLTPSSDNFTDRLPLKSTHPPINDIVEKLWLESHSPIKSKNASIKRQHVFESKPVLRPNTCGSCNQRIRFAKMVLKCKECRALCHAECKNDLPLPCIPLMSTPTQKGSIGILADYAPSTPPMIPALIVHCINEIELRGLNEVGIYRVPGSEKDVKVLKDNFLRGRSTPSLNDVDVHVICGVVKDFLRSLREPLLTNALWKDFTQIADLRDTLDIAPALYQVISQLPQPNRDTLAYIMVHLNRVGQSKECKMPASNLSKVFGPTIVGYSSQDIDAHALLTETRLQVTVMEYLLNIPTDFWKSFIDIGSNLTTPRSKVLPHTPSTETLKIGRFFTPTSATSVQSTKKRRKFFGTPPSKK